MTDRAAISSQGTILIAFKIYDIDFYFLCMFNNKNTTLPRFHSIL